ncbi:MAG: heparinase II/III family protein [Acidobacteria bacterium]|nr:heparinase II/III family protein [Acidobacteriota bacterium]
MHRAFLLSLLCCGALAGQSRFLSEADFARIRDTIDGQRWAATVRTNFVNAAEAWPQSHLARYGLRELALPPDGGQWTHWYVCPSTGVRLRFEPPNGHVCPSDNRRLTGWPYDQVIYADRHDALANAARDLAFAYRLTGNASYAAKAAWILNAYAERYPALPLHDRDNRNTRSGARVHAQTLDEAIWLLPLAWAFDLLNGTEALSPEQSARIERHLLRDAAATLLRNDAGISNWQSWHNAALAAVAITVNDTPLLTQALDGPSGLRFQLRQSVTPDGFWYEGSFTYHYYALDALWQTAELAARAGDISLFAEPSFQSLFSAPLRFALPGGTLPPFNDAVTVNLQNYSRWYESAYARWGDPLFALLAASRARGREALLFGLPELPAAPPSPLTSVLFPDAGYAVLRAPVPADHTLVLKYGPHGGGHGHYDKLNFVSYARGGILAIDPGTQAYGAPTHATWDQQTIAHNTITVDERTQAAATGQLLASQFEPNFAFVRATAGQAYTQARLTRSLLLTSEYTLDLFEAAATDQQSHQFDWAYHNQGEVLTNLSLGPAPPLPRTMGYQHLTANRSAATDADWQLRFDGARARLLPYGAIYASTTNVKGAFTTSREQAATGTGSGRIDYRFSGPGYLLYSTPNLTNLPQPDNRPAGLRLMIYGDGSRHRIALRVNDTTDERFVAPLLTIDWTGWKEVTVTNPQTWTHYLGNDDGVIDLPIRTASIELQQTNGAPAEGAFFVDDIDLLYETGDPLRIAGFEVPILSLRLWMLGEPGTQVVTGNGLGEDLTKPVPYVLARRRGAGTEFLSLLEPYGAEPEITGFRRTEDGAILITAPNWTDTIRFTPTGVEYSRQ